MTSLVPIKSVFKKKPIPIRHKRSRQKSLPKRPSTDFAALIDAIKAEGRALRTEEKREDTGKTIREWITAGLVGLTMIGVFWQVHEMIKVYGPVRDQAEASKKAAEAATKQSENSDKSLIEAQRAWVGPTNANFASEPAVGKNVEITVQYQNTGHGPALGFVYSIEPFLITSDEDAGGAAGMRILNYMKTCENTNEWNGGSVIYPTTSAFGAGYSLNSKTNEEFVDEAMTKGEKTVIVQGCFLYRTFNVPRHSYFCYFYKQGFTKIQNLNICTSGHYAD